MRRPLLFRKRYPLVLILLLLVIAIPSVHASTYVGYGSSNCTGGCGTTNWQNNYGNGKSFASPFTGTLFSVGIFTATAGPSNVIILTTAAAVTGSTYGCTAGQTCGQITDNLFTFTVADDEPVTLGTNSFQTVNLANPVSVTNGQFVAIMFTGSASSCQNATCVTILNSGGLASILDTCMNFASNTPGVGLSFVGRSVSGSGDANCNGTGAGIMGASFNPTNPGGVTVTQCYGNCGSPPITLANTNSTHAINFNQTITLLYEFQSNVNGFVLNVTTNLSKNYFGNVFLAVYTIPNCPFGQTPFSPSCPGLLQQSQSQLGLKGKNSMGINGLAVTNGQWVGIAVTATLAGLDLNDTNTNVSLFQTNEGRNPPAIQGAVVQSATSKVGLWAWVRGNVVTGQPPTTPNGSCQSFATIDCWVPALVNGFCSNASPQCQTASALFWILVLSILFEVALAYCFNTAVPNLKVPFGEMFLFIILIWTFILTGLSLIFVWVPVFFFMVASVVFSKHTGRYF